MGVWVYYLKEDYQIQLHNIKGHTFDNEWFHLDDTGLLTVKGSNKNGYAWDGCSVKFKIKDIWFGVPEGIINQSTGLPKTYRASLVHDLLYQFRKQIRKDIKWGQADREFYLLLKEDEFSFAKIYYIMTRIFGWTCWFF